jgi:hypothetical protein
MGEIKTICRCGRKLGPVPHCVRCGSPTVYSKAAASGIIDGALSPGFHCRKCGRDFHQLEPCEAPPTKLALQAQRELEDILKGGSAS